MSKVKEMRFKKTKIGKIPEDVDISTIGEHFEVKYGLGQPPDLDPSGIPLIRATNIKNGEIIDDGLIFIDESKMPGKSIRLKEGDILVVRSGAYTGDVASIRKEWKGCIAGYDLVLSLRESSKSILNPLYAAYYLLSPLNQQGHFMQSKSRSAQPHLNANQLRQTPIPLLEFNEQNQVVEIFETIRNMIISENKIHIELQSAKKGLMQRLLTRGIGHTRFKQTKIGEVPENWEVLLLPDVCELSSGAQIKYEPNEFLDSFPVYGANGILGWCHVTNLKKGIVIGRVGASGTVHYVDEPSWANDNTLVLREARRVSRRFLFYWLLNSNLQKLSTKTAQPLLTQRTLKMLHVPVPDFKEQQRITGILDELTNMVRIEEDLMKYKKQLKKGLMQVLLTGKVRVKT